MQRAIPQLSDCSGIKFFKTLGTGSSSGFSLWPDFSTYAILTVWEDESKAIDFLKNSKLMKKFISHSASQQHFSLHTLQTYGLWGKTNPFKAVKRNLAEDELIEITPSNLRLRNHLSIDIPEPKAAKIRVGNEWRYWDQGKSMAFDDSYEHEVMHKGNRLRVILSVDIWHPSLTKKEIKILSHPVFKNFGYAELGS